MKLLIQLLIGLIVPIALGLYFHPEYPTITMSLLLLAPLPIFLIGMLFKAFRQHRLIIGCALIPILFAFYVGLSGPIFAMAALSADEEIGAALLVAWRNAYPIVLVEPHGGLATETFMKYQAGWVSIYEPEFWEDSRFGTKN